MENYVPQRKIRAIPGHLTKELKVSLQASDLPWRKDDMMEESGDKGESNRVRAYGLIQEPELL